MKKYLVYFVLIAFGFAWLAAALIPILDYGYGSFASIIIVACLVMPAPALAAWIVQTYIVKLPFSELDVTWKHANKPQLSLLPLWLFIFLLAFLNSIQTLYFSSSDPNSLLPYRSRGELVSGMIFITPS